MESDSSYDQNGRLVELVNRRSNGTIVSAYAYTLDNAGNRTQVVDNTGRTVGYTYDGLSRLLSETINEPGEDTVVITHTYDAVGNREAKETCIGDPPVCETITYTYNDNDLLITETGPTYTVNYAYDNNGNTVEKYNATDTVTFAYNSKDQLIEADTIDYLIEYAYDPDGTRVSKTVDGALVSYLVDKNRPYGQVLEERDGANQLLAAYTYGKDLINMRRGGVESYYHYDALGSACVLSDGSESVTDEYEYQAYGVLISQTGTTENAYLFTGEQFDPESGLYYLRARYYDPEIGRFITRDTWRGDPRRPSSINKYMYAEGNPVVFTDPSGHFLGGMMVVVGVMIQLAATAIPSFSAYTQSIINYAVPGYIQVFAQPSDLTCWDATTAMMLSWKNRESYGTIEDAIATLGSYWLKKLELDEGITGWEYEDYLTQVGLKYEAPTSRDAFGLAMMMRAHGPILASSKKYSWQGILGNHARIIKKIKGDGTPTGTKLTLINPEFGAEDVETLKEFAGKQDQMGTVTIRMAYW